MKTMKKNILLYTIFFITTLCSLQATMVEYKEDVYTAQAQPDLVNLAQKAATLVGFDKPYEVVAPKPAGIEINPLNKFISHGINPSTKNHFILINPEWLAKMPEEQQLFFFVRDFLIFMQETPFSIKYIPYLFVIVSLCMALLFFWIVGKTRLRNTKIWIRILIALALAVAGEFLFTDRLQAMISRYLVKRFEIKILTLAVEKTKDKDAAIKALEFYDSSIGEESHNDEKFWAPYKNLFGEYAQELKRLA